VETTGIDLNPLIGRQIQAGDAILLLCEARTPCQKMDEICKGLRGLMENRRQGVLAQVIRDGTIRVGDPIFPVG
jgi:MOSC domain-containing protein YiiM